MAEPKDMADAGEPLPAPQIDPEAEPFEGRVALGGLSMRQFAARGTLINGAFLIGLSGLNLARGFLVAAFLLPSEFGLWSLVAVGLGTLVYLKQVGIGDKYIQQADEDQEAAFQKAFTIELMLTLIFVVVLSAAVPLLALIYGREELLALGFAFVLALPAAALTAPLWIFYRKMQFLRQRTLQAVEPIVGFVVTIGLAVAGAGTWALAIGLVAGVWAGAIVAVAASPYKLRLRYDRGTLREYASFSWPLFFYVGSAMLMAQASVMVGNWEVGVAGVGAIALATRYSRWTNRVDTIVTGTMYPAICAVRDRTDLLFESFVKSNRLTLMWGFPFGIGLTLFADDLVSFVIGEQWRLAVVLLQAYGVITATNHIGFNWDAFFRARGSTRPMATVAVLQLVTFGAAAIPLLIAHGLSGFAVGMGIMNVVSLGARGYFLSKLFPRFQMLKHALRSIAPTVPAALVVLLARLVEQGGERTLGLALAELGAYVAVTAVATVYFERALLREVLGYLRPAPREPTVAT